MPRSLRMLDDSTRLVEITTRTVQGRFLMLPSAAVNDLILGVMGRAQAKYGMTLHAYTFMANHKHVLASPVDEEQMALFMGFLNGNIAKELGRLHSWRDKFWARRYHSASVSLDEDEQVRRFLYILDNGCKEGLVGSPLAWPGVSSAEALCTGTMKQHGTWYDRTAQYRASLCGEYKEFPSAETVTLTPLPFLQDKSEDEQRGFYIGAVREVEEKTARMHKENGTRPMGARAMRRQRPHDSPKDFKPSPAPSFHARGESFWAMYNARRAKVAAYREAAERLKRGEKDVSFPEGSFPPRLPFVKPRAPT